MAITEKRCSKCGEIKFLSEFYKRKNSIDGVRTDCKSCRKKYYKIYCKNNPEKIKKSTKTWNKNNPEKIKLSYELWSKNNLEIIKHHHKVYRTHNLEKIKELNKSFRENEPEKALICSYLSNYGLNLSNISKDFYKMLINHYKFKLISK